MPVLGVVKCWTRQTILSWWAILMRRFRQNQINNAEIIITSHHIFLAFCFHAHIRSAVVGVPCEWVGTSISSGQWVIAGSNVYPFWAEQLSEVPWSSLCPLAWWPVKYSTWWLLISLVPELRLLDDTTDMWSEKAVDLDCFKLLRFTGVYYCTIV